MLGFRDVRNWLVQGSKPMRFRKEAMTAQKHIVRDVFVVLLCATFIILAVSAIVHKAATAFNPFLPDGISQRVNIFFSPKVVEDSRATTFQPLPSAIDVPSQRSPDSNRTEILAGAGSLQGVPVPAPASYPDELDVVLAPAPAPDKLDKVLLPAAPEDELDRVLAKTANSNRTVIITALNGAWAEPNTMIDLFLESFRVGEGTPELLNNLLIVALDAKAYDRCLEIHPHCYTLKTRGVDFSAEKLYMSDDYLKMMWRRLGFLADILKRGYSFVFSDADIMWLRNPFTRFSPDADIQIASDQYNGSPYDVHNMPNGGYKYVRSNERTVSFYRYWYLSRRLFPGQNEQDVLNIVKFTRGFSRRGMKFMFLSTQYFGGFCQRSEYLDDVCTMHANCCKGLKAKLTDLRQTLDDWSEYRNPPLNSTRNVSEWRPPYACLHSWDN
jgi:hypothetical protein